MEEFPANSRKAKTGEDDAVEPKKIEKVVAGGVVRRKKPLGKRFAETFVGGDAKGVWNYVLFDVLIPAAKDMASDAVTQAVERMLFGENRSSSRRSASRRGGKPNDYVSYNRYSSPSNPPWHDRRDESSRNVSRRARASHDFDEIILATRAEAEEVIDRLFDLVSKYESASVADLYELVGVTGSYTDDKWGWTDIRGAGATRVRNGYLLDLPKPEPLD